MLDKQSKNTIKLILLLLFSIIIGEGVLNFGVYWPVLLVSLNRKDISWLALLTGIVVGALHGVSFGFMSLFLVVVLGGLALFVDMSRGLLLILIVVSFIGNLIFDKIFGFNWSVVEGVAVALYSFMVVKWYERNETIKINY